MFSFEHINYAVITALISFIVGGSISAWLAIGDLGIPSLNYAGAAAGYIVDAALTAFFYCSHIGWHKDFHQYKFFKRLKNIRENWSQFFDLVKMRASISCAITVEFVMPVATGIMVGWIGTMNWLPGTLR